MLLLMTLNSHKTFNKYFASSPVQGELVSPQLYVLPIENVTISAIHKTIQFVSVQFCEYKCHCIGYILRSLLTCGDDTEMHV